MIRPVAKPSEDSDVGDAASGDDEAPPSGKGVGKRSPAGDGQGHPHGGPALAGKGLIPFVGPAGPPPGHRDHAAKGRGKRHVGGDAVRRGSRQVPWGARVWSYGPTTTGFGADCRCHTNSVDLPTTTHCKKNLPFSKVSPLSEDEHRRLCKVWPLMGLEIPEGDRARSAHVAVDPRLHHVGVSEAELDATAASLNEH